MMVVVLGLDCDGNGNGNRIFVRNDVMRAKHIKISFKEAKFGVRVEQVTPEEQRRKSLRRTKARRVCASNR